MTLKETILADCLTIEADLENPTFIWDDTTYICIPSSDEFELQMSRGGNSQIKTLNLRVRTDQFGDGVYPEAQDLITYRSKDYAIAVVREDTTGALITLVCVSDSRGS